MWLDDLPIHSSISRAIPKADPIDDDDVDEGEFVTEDILVDDHPAYVLKVERGIHTVCPEPPPSLTEWLGTGWQDLGSQVFHHMARPSIALQENVIEGFDADPSRVRDFEAWQARRELWVENENLASKSSVIFERLYDLYGRIQRESERDLILFSATASSIGHGT
jgi:hypothetical protein